MNYTGLPRIEGSMPAIVPMSVFDHRHLRHLAGKHFSCRSTKTDNGKKGIKKNGDSVRQNFLLPIPLYLNIMAQLDPNWITTGIIDFEYKKYLLLAYLQKIGLKFNEKELYPFLSDLVFHYNNLISIKKSKTIAVNQFPKKLTKIEFQNFKLEYERLIHDDEYMEEIESIVDFSLPKLKDYLKEGKGLYEFIEDKLLVYPVGVLPIKPVAGYMFLKEKEKRNVRIYEYAVTIFENADEKYRGLKTQFVSTCYVSISNTFEMMKVDLLKSNKSLPNPATYAVESGLSLPFEETFLPVAKRMLVKKISESLE